MESCKCPLGWRPCDKAGTDSCDNCQRRSCPDCLTGWRYDPDRPAARLCASCNNRTLKARIILATREQEKRAA